MILVALCTRCREEHAVVGGRIMCPRVDEYDVTDTRVMWVCGGIPTTHNPPCRLTGEEPAPSLRQTGHS